MISPLKKYNKFEMLFEFILLSKLVFALEIQRSFSSPHRFACHFSSYNTHECHVYAINGHWIYICICVSVLPNSKILMSQWKMMLHECKLLLRAKPFDTGIRNEQLSVRQTQLTHMHWNRIWDIYRAHRSTIIRLVYVYTCTCVYVCVCSTHSHH